jgi:hypothetical protein
MLTAVVALSPLIADWAYKVYVHPRAYWIVFWDPEAIHYYNGGLMMARGEVPSNVDNPATPLQAINAAIAKIGGYGAFDFDRLRTAAYVVNAFLLAGACLLLARRASRPALCVACIWLYFCSPPALERLTVWSPESLYFLVAVWLALALSALVRQPGRLLAFASVGAAVGFACSLKILFVAVALALTALPFAGSRDESRMARASAVAVGFASSFVFFTLPIVPAYPRMFAWIGRLTTRSGAYGEGERGAPVLTSVVGSLREALLSAKL